MNYAGIDISKYKHDLFVMSDFGEVITERLSFANNSDGFAQLKRELDLCGLIWWTP